MDRLQRTSHADSVLFQKFANQGHTKDVGVRGLGKQGTYAVTPSGVMLASVNSPEGKDVAAMLEEALGKWKKLSRAERLLSTPLDRNAAAEWRWWDAKYPKDGLVLRVISRDLPRKEISPQWRFAWGLDHAWFQKAEARKLVPADVRPGSKTEIPPLLVERLARFHLVDSVRARETIPFSKAGVKHARLTSEIVAVTNETIWVRFEGETRTSEECDLFPDEPRARLRSFAAKLLGRGCFDLKSERFSSFELLAIGERRGATSCNMRVQDKDLGPAPISVLLSLASASPIDQVPPAFLSQYQWE